MVTGCSEVASPGSAIWLASSSEVSAARPSPPASETIVSSASSESEKAPARPWGSSRARRTSVRTDPSSRGWSSTTRDREMRAELTSKYGFSVVAPMRMTVRSSTAWSRASCCERLKRWISSTKRIVRRPVESSRLSAASISRRRSLTVPVMAETSTNSACVVLAMMRASVVLPVPAGPYRMTDESVSCSIALRSHEPSPTACACPT